MVVEITGKTVGECYKEALIKMQIFGRDTGTRNGRALTIEEPVVMTLLNPSSRVLRDPNRDANPFFHCMEFVWMMTGSPRVDWIKRFNSRMGEFANGGILNGAYGNRWRYPVDQIIVAAQRLRKDPDTRQAVISMWDSNKDTESGMNDYPCNTHIYFRVLRSKLNMTVCNRSNDLVWGMLGANVVHMTLLQELVAAMAGIPMGKYQVFTNNLHIYERHWPLLDTISSVDTSDGDYDLGPELGDYHELQNNCHLMVAGGYIPRPTPWVAGVAYPMMKAYTDKPRRMEWIEKIAAPDWREACREWTLRRLGSTDKEEMS